MWADSCTQFYGIEHLTTPTEVIESIRGKNNKVQWDNQQIDLIHVCLWGTPKMIPWLDQNIFCLSPAELETYTVNA